MKTMKNHAGPWEATGPEFNNKKKHPINFGEDQSGDPQQYD